KTYALSRSRIKAYECPSDNPYTISTTRKPDPAHGGIYTEVVANYKNSGVALGWYYAADFVDAGGLPGLTNYVPVAGTTGTWVFTNTSSLTQQFYAAHEGIFVDEKLNSIGSVSDGTSNTALFAEYVGAFLNGNSGPRVRSLAWMGSGGFSSFYCILDMSDADNARFSYGSMHPGIV